MTTQEKTLQSNSVTVCMQSAGFVMSVVTFVADR